MDRRESSPGPPLSSDDATSPQPTAIPLAIANGNENAGCEEIVTSEGELEDPGDVFQDCTIFGGISYLGAASINAPKSQSEIQRNMKILNEQSSDHVIKLSVSVPSCSDGSVVLYDAVSNSVVARYEINRILFYSRGSAESPEASCFAFTLSHGDTQESTIYQCHIFRCDIPEAVGQVSACFIKAFQRVPKSLTTSVNGELTSDDQESVNKSNNTHMFVFEVSMEIKEEDGRGGFSAVPKDQSCFKVRVNVEKQITLTVQQVVNQHEHDLIVERCFGVLLSPGRHVKHSDMQLLEMISTGSDVMPDKQCRVISVQWDPKEAAFELLNTESRETRIYFTVAMDLVIRGIREPVRFSLESSVKIYSQNERFWNLYGRRTHIQQFYVNLKEVASTDMNETLYEVVSIEPSGELDRSRLNLTLNNIASFIRSPSVTSIDTLTPKEECPSDGDEPLLSGTGNVSKEVTEVELLSWKEVLDKWPSSSSSRPRQLPTLVRQGIPEALRGEVWLRLAGCDLDNKMMETYKLLIAKECSYENVIKRDINRTFPAHDQFKDPGVGQENLSRISRAYAVYDTEVGYCQGLSFLAATLLLHMPEEQTFCVLVKLMFDYGLRDLYKDGFECLYLRLYQLNRLMEEQVPQLWKHFAEKGVESHMFASQWFLTLFTARFPLYFVFHIIDVFLLQGMETLFQIAIALLMVFRKDLLQLDFENVLKYFRVTLPKKCRNEETARQVIKLACSLKMKKLRKYEQEFIALKEAQDNADKYSTELERVKYILQRTEEEKKRLEDELYLVKEMLKREVQKAENDSNKSTAIIAEYKKINRRLENEQTAAKTALNQLRVRISSCEKCCSLATENINNDSNENTEGKDNRQTQCQERIKELELELAQAKLAQVEAECQNQDLTHQLSSALTELQTARNSWPPWLHKTLTSIKEVTANKATQNQRRDSAPADTLSRDETAF
ncbi:GTPase activating protein and centrosome-associated isoform X2 [Lycorma delicatula]